MLDKIENSRRFPVNSLPRPRFFGLVALVGLVWLLGLQPVTAAPLKSVSTSREQKVPVTVQGGSSIQLSSTFCGQTVNIMPLGNSITKGTGTGAVPNDDNFNYGYRYYLYNLLNNSTYYGFDFVGTRVHGFQSGYVFDYDHEGWGGYLADQLLPNVPGYLAATQPDVILLHIGTNDVAQRTDDNYAADVADVAAILDVIDAYSTDAIVILAQIIDQDQNDLVNYQPGAVSTYNGLLATMAQNRITSGDKLVLVDMYNALDYSPNGDMHFDEAYLPDDWLHPNDGGYEKMAGVWFSALEAIQPDCSAPVITTTAPVTGFVDKVYTYDVDATGVPAPTYTLTTAPNGMTIDAGTGVISWTPAQNQTGSHNIVVEATSASGTDTQAFAVTVLKQGIFLPFIQK